MMFLFLGMCLIWFFVLFSSSLHFIILLILVEFMVLFSFLFFSFWEFSYLSCIFFLLVGVCVGAYSISVFVVLCRYKVSSYLMSFFYY